MTTENSPRKTYAAATQRDQFPTRDQAIVIESKDGIQLRDYIYAIGAIVTPPNVRFASRISNGRVCIFLASKELAAKLVSEHPRIKIGEYSLEVRLLITRHKRIIISNACPSIPHSEIEAAIDKHNVRRSSSISYLRVAMPDPIYGHVQSARRQVYIHPEDVGKLPSSLLITADDTTFRIFLSTDTLRCFHCKDEGHIAINCPSQKNASDVPTQDNENLINVNINTETVITHQVNTQNVNTTETENKQIQIENINLLMRPPTTGLKRTLSSTTSTSTNVSKEGKISNAKKSGKIKIKQPSKKQKSSEVITEEIALHLLPVKELISSEEKSYPIDLEKLTEFLVKTYDNSKVTETAYSYTNDLPSLCKMLDDIKVNIADKKLKNRITRIMKKIHQSENTDYSSDDSLSVDNMSNNDTPSQTDNE